MTDNATDSVANESAGGHSRPADVYPTGHAGATRAWDGQVWTGPVITDSNAAELHAKRSLGRMLRRLPFWIAIGGIIIGIALSLAGVNGERNTALLIIGGFIATGGPILALVLGVHRRLGLAGEEIRVPTLVGIGAGVAAIGVALILERLVAEALGSKEGKPSEWLLAAAGPIEEGAKLLVPVILLVAGVAFIRRPLIGVWVVLISGGMFGAIEGALYAANLGGQRNYDPSISITDSFPNVSEATARELAELLTVIPRIWTELGHPLWVTGAAVLIWVAAWEGRKNLALFGIGAYLAAAALHTFNDAVLSRLPGALPAAASIAFITLSYVLWFRPLVRKLVPPSHIAEVPERWIPALPSSNK